MVAAMAGESELVKCRECDAVLARVGRNGGVYPLDGVRVTIEGRRVDLQCPECEQWHRLRLGQYAA